MSGLQNSLMQKLSSAGWTVRSDGSQISAEREEILSKWMLGKRSVKLQLGLAFDEPNKTLTFLEVMVEKSSGLPPPNLSMTTTSQNSKKVTERRTDISVGGGGTLDYGNARQWIERECGNEGWTFKIKI